MPNVYPDYCKEHDDCRAHPELGRACCRARRHQELDVIDQAIDQALERGRHWFAKELRARAR